jgi:catechol 2,3-dioxygenase-like lactoylglutathione lyase family enzyme
MPSPNCLLLYVADVERSVGFYGRLLDRQPVEQSPNFAMFILDNGMPLGLWAEHDVQPRPASGVGGVEIAIQVPEKPLVDAIHAEWTAAGVAILQGVVDMDFGRTFAGADPDGHRLRVFAPHQG